MSAAELRLPTCSRCGATISFARTLAGKAMPLDPGANENGNVYLNEEGRAVVLGKDDPERSLDRHLLLMPHWATCAAPKKAEL